VLRTSRITHVCWGSITACKSQLGSWSWAWNAQTRFATIVTRHAWGFHRLPPWLTVLPIQPSWRRARPPCLQYLVASLPPPGVASGAATPASIVHFTNYISCCLLGLGIYSVCKLSASFAQAGMESSTCQGLPQASGRNRMSISNAISGVSLRSWLITFKLSASCFWCSLNNKERPALCWSFATMQVCFRADFWQLKGTMHG